MLSALRREERIGLAIAAALHVALAAALLTRPTMHENLPVPERMTVNLSEDVSLAATAPDPASESRAAVAPTLSDLPAPAPVEAAQPEVQPRVAPAPPKPLPATPAKPAPAKPAKSAVDKAAPAKKPPATKGGGSLVGKDFLAGVGDSKTATATGAPAVAVGPREAASLLQAIVRELRPKWQAPSGADASQLATLVMFRLNPDGSLAGRPTVVRQSGITDANRAQASRHAEQAIRAVQLAAPFALPPEYYSAWKKVSITFDWNLSQ